MTFHRSDHRSSRVERPSGLGSRFARTGLASHLVLLALLVGVPAAHAQTGAAAGMTDADYLAFSDRMQAVMEDSWSEREGLYRAGDGSGPMVNSNMLLAHAVAAARGHTGPSRNDERARRIALRLVSSPPFVEQASQGPPGSSSQAHAPGWVNSSRNPQATQHLVFDADVVDGLVHAWRARSQLGLPQSTSDLIVDRIVRTTHGWFWRYPTIRLNQINWYAMMYAAAAEMTGDPTLLRTDFHQQLMRFTADVGHDGKRAGNFGPGLRFHYLPDRPLDRRLNVDSAEYANIVFSFSRFYEQARLAGMPNPPTRVRRLLRQWGIRVLSGYWTHAGYMNWDTGLGFNRWHQTKKLGLAQQALIGLASTEALQTARSRGPWAKWILDRGFRLFDEWTRRAGRVPPAVAFGVNRKPLAGGSARLGAARMQGNAARAIAAGLGAMPAAQPPALYAYDADIGRLAVTTPAYNTAIVAVNQRGFPYGGIELARLFDGDQDVSANLGGRPPASFGMEVRSPGGSRLGNTQVGRDRIDYESSPLELVRAPRGEGEMPDALIGNAFAGPFEDLKAEGLRTTARHELKSSHRFRPWYIETAWTATARTRAHARKRYGMDVSFPSTGPNAHVLAVLADGRRVPVADAPIPLAAVSYFHVQSELSGYVIVPVERPRGARARTRVVPTQWSAPQAGPTLVVEAARARRFRSVSFSARMVPVRNPDSADATARQLGAR
jgi:hypothetical protein